MESNEKLVDYLVTNNYIESESVEEAFRKVDRGDFVPKSTGEAYRDHPFAIEKGSTVSAPHMVAIITELLSLEGEERVLEMGSDSGYLLAVVSRLTRGEIVGVETENRLVEESMENLREYENVRVIEGDSIDVAEGLFDRIVYSFSVDSIDDAKNHISEEGIIIAPVKDRKGQVLKRFYAGNETWEDHGHVRFVGRK